MRRLGIVLGIVLAMSAPAWAQSVSELEGNLQNLIAQAQPAPAVPAPRPAAVQGTVGAGVARGADSEVSRSAPFVATYNTAGNKLTVLTSNNRSDNPISSLQVGSGTWWNNPDVVTLLALTKDQQKKMDDIFQQHRIKLIDLNASLLKEETILEPLLAADKLDEAKILVQVDKIAQARAELEKDNSRLLLSLRQTLTMEQWTKVQTPSNSRILNQRR